MAHQDRTAHTISPTPRIAPVVVIMGASSGIGEATAEAFARFGARLILAARDGSALEAVAKRCRDMGAPALAIATDVTDPDAVKRLAGQALAFGGRIDVWVSNVGTGAVGAFHETPIAAHEQVVRTNLIGHMNDAHAVLPLFIKQRRGVFINMISLGGFAPAPYATAYSASKFGLRGFAEALRGELVDYPNIHICDIYPAFVDTPGLSHGANYAGKELSAPPPLLDPRTVAAAIVRLTRNPRPTTMLGAATGLVRLGHFLAPELSTWLMSKFMTSYFRHAAPVARSSGNLFQPPAVPGGIDGGLRSARQRNATVAVAGLLLLGLVVRAARARR
ncbi:MULTISPECIES: SDR family oxidoreductase [unclassified Chelatococcus]|uniref:SDR family oxidoreductase n=1 Tax=unclassified Chelatococcus TaxID=2638111 RepID=UPI001BCB0096|nr:MULTISPECIES: SDR family oxidoreductase [unclassified Chelatococcus]MBS7700403.1 SDR family oxidoreductase [Chelatococcus sp. YT9]MBX3556199.1 SDR family oxidoreductase [Chelatococcus sp.]